MGACFNIGTRFHVTRSAAFWFRPPRALSCYGWSRNLGNGLSFGWRGERQLFFLLSTQATENVLRDNPGFTVY